MPVSYDKRNKRWRFRFRRTIAGNLIRASRLLPPAWDRAAAESFDRAESARLYGVASGVLKDEPLIERAVEKYLAHHEHELKNWKKCMQDLALLLPWYAGKSFSELPAIAAAYIKDQRETLAPATIRNRLAYLRSACRWAWKHHGMGEFDPAGRMVMPAVNNERDEYASDAQVEKLARACALEETRAIVRLAFYTGLRWITGIWPRTKGDLTKVDGVWWMRVGVTKNGKLRMVPIHPKAVASLKHIPFALHHRTYYADFQQARLAIGMPTLRMHDLRHSLASAIISGGGTLAEVQGALGHDSVQSAKRYAHLYPQALKAVLWRVGQKPGHKDRAEKPKKAA